MGELPSPLVKFELMTFLENLLSKLRQRILGSDLKSKIFQIDKRADDISELFESNNSELDKRGPPLKGFPPLMRKSIRELDYKIEKYGHLIRNA